MHHSFGKTPKYPITSSLDWKNVDNSYVDRIWVADYPGIPFIILAKAVKKTDYGDYYGI